MKAKSLFFSLCALATLASCSNDGDNAAPDSVGETMFLKLSMAQTRAMEGPIVDEVTPTFTTAKFTFYSKGTEYTALPAITKTAAEAMKGFVQTGIPMAVDSIGVTTEGSTDEIFEEAIITYQGKGAATDLAKYRLVGGAKIEAGSGEFESTPYSKIATVNLTSDLSRFQITSAAIAPENSNIKAVRIEGVYLNYFVENRTSLKADPVVYKDFGQNIVKYDVPVLKDEATAGIGLDFIGKCAAYQVFNGFMPHVIVKVRHSVKGDFADAAGDKVTVMDTDGVTPKEVTLTQDMVDGMEGYFTVAAYQKEGALLVQSEGNKIYNVDMTATVKGKYDGVNFDPENPGSPADPTPEANFNLKVEVKVVPWTIENIIPQL